MFDLHNLGWSSFQQLCHTITREILGQTVESFLDSNDGGRDGAFTGLWKTAGQESFSGQFVIQCKFTSKINHALKMSDISDEIDKAKRLVSQGLCDSYVLMSNAGISGTTAEKIRSAFEQAGVKHVATLGSTWISQQILENKRLRMLVPRVYGLGDLGQILDDRAYAQARTILESMREDLAKVVVTDAYRRAVDAINAHGFVLLIGEPAAGKTTIASLLAMAALDQWNASTLKLDNPGQVVEHWNPEEPSQFFWLDDAFGVTQYEDFLVRGWNHILPQAQSMLRKGTKIVMTSRDYIYNRARKDLKESAFPLFKESQVVIDVHELSANEKRQILYNHLKLGRQSRSFLADIKPYLENVANHSRFIPETARRLADPLFTNDLFLDEYYIGQFVERREQLLRDILQNLDIDSKAALALIFMRNGQLESPIELQASESQALERLGSDLGNCITTLETLKGSLVLFSSASGNAAWEFKHPTIGDAYATLLAQNPEHLGIFIQGSAPERLIDQVTCGDVEIKNAVIVPNVLFPQMLQKLKEMSQSKTYKSAWLSAFGAERDLHGFLSHRCSKEFLALYLQDNPGLLDDISEPGLYLYAASEVRLAQRLHEFGLLPEKSRKLFVETVSKYALEGHDASAMNNDKIKRLFEKEELDILKEKVRNELLPNLENIRNEWESNHSAEDSAEEYMQPFLEIFGILKECLDGDEKATKIIVQQEQLTNDWIEENTTEEAAISPRSLEKIETQVERQSVRSIFDDIDVGDDDID